MAALISGDFSNLKAHIKEINRSGFWTDVVAQLNKDIGDDKAVFFNPGHLLGEDAAEELVKTLQRYLPSVTPRLSEILYRIDINEENTLGLKDLPTDMYYQVLSEIIVKRVVQKTLTRIIFSDKKTL